MDTAITDGTITPTYESPSPVRRVGVRATLRRWRTVRATRRALLVLDDARLADIGLDRLTARAEARRPFWR